MNLQTYQTQSSYLLGFAPAGLSCYESVYQFVWIPIEDIEQMHTECFYVRFPDVDYCSATFQLSSLMKTYSVSNRSHSRSSL